MVPVVSSFEPPSLAWCHAAATVLQVKAPEEIVPEGRETGGQGWGKARKFIVRRLRVALCRVVRPGSTSGECVLLVVKVSVPVSAKLGTRSP